MITIGVQRGITMGVTEKDTRILDCGSYVLGKYKGGYEDIYRDIRRNKNMSSCYLEEM